MTHKQGNFHVSRSPDQYPRQALPLRLVILGISFLSWMGLIAISQSRYSQLLDHGDWTQAAMLSSICAVLPNVAPPLSVLVTTVMWIVMVLAMMLPLSISQIQNLVAGENSESKLRNLSMGFGGGYLAISIVFGIILHGAGYLLTMAAARFDYFIFNGWVIGVAVIAVAGLYQFSSTKRVYIQRSCEVSIAHRRRGYKEANSLCSGFERGFQHGYICIMCCWAMMCLMFVFWTGSVLWMLAITAAMSLERIAIRGVSLRAPVGFALLAFATGVGLSHM